MIREMAIAQGVAGVKQTLIQMVLLARAGQANNYVQLAVKHITPFQYDEKLRQLWQYTEEQSETLFAVDFQVRNMMQYGKMIGDCDDAAIIAGALALAAWYRVRFVAVRRPESPTFSHVFAEVIPDSYAQTPIHIDPTAPLETDYHNWERLEQWL